MKCLNCGSNNPEGAKFCSTCGQKIVEAEYLCPKCHQPLYDKSKFCNNCGNELIWDVPDINKIPVPINDHKKSKIKSDQKNIVTLLIFGEIISFVFIVCVTILTILISWGFLYYALFGVISLIINFMTIVKVANNRKVNKALAVFDIIFGFLTIINVCSIIAGFKLLLEKETINRNEALASPVEEQLTIKNNNYNGQPSNQLLEQESPQTPNQEEKIEEIKAEPVNENKQEENKQPSKEGSRVGGFFAKIGTAVKETFKGTVSPVSTNNEKPIRPETKVQDKYDCEDKPVDWFIDPANNEIIEQYIKKDNYFIDDDICERMKEEFTDEYESLNGSLVGFECIRGERYEENKYLPTILFNCFLTSFVESIGAEEIIDSSLTYYLAGLFKIHNRPYYIDESGDLVDRLPMPVHLIFNRTQNPYLRYLDLLMENIGNSEDLEEVSTELSLLVFICLRFIFNEMVNCNARVIEENPWLYDRNTIGNKLRTEEQFRNKCKNLAKNPEYFTTGSND